jgi:hypothetical protein
MKRRSCLEQRGRSLEQKRAPGLARLPLVLDARRLQHDRHVGLAVAHPPRELEPGVAHHAATRGNSTSEMTPRMLVWYSTK